MKNNVVSRKKRCCFFILVIVLSIIYNIIWYINYDVFSGQSRDYKLLSHNAWYRESNGYIYTLTKPHFPSMKVCYAITDIGDTVSLFVWKNSFSSSYKMGMEIYEKKSNVYYQFMLDDDFEPERESMEIFSNEEKGMILAIIKQKYDIIEQEYALAEKEWNL